MWYNKYTSKIITMFMREMMQNNQILGGSQECYDPQKRVLLPYFQTHPNQIVADTSHCIPFYPPDILVLAGILPSFQHFCCLNRIKKDEQKHESPAMLRTFNTSTIIIINIKYVYIYMCDIYTLYIYIYVYMYYTSAGGFRPTKYESFGIILQKRAHHLKKNKKNFFPTTN